MKTDKKEIFLIFVSIKGSERESDGCFEKAGVVAVDL